MLVGAFSVIVQPVVEPMDRFAALLLTLAVIIITMTICPVLAQLRRPASGLLAPEIREHEETASVRYEEN